jgi:hypothetical protein
VARIVALQRAGKRIDLDRPRWRLANRLIALCSACADSLCASRVGRRGDARAGTRRSLRHRFIGAVSYLNHLFIRLLMGRRAASVEQELDSAAI